MKSLVKSKMKNKIIYIWDYYRLKIAFAIIGIAITISIINSVTHNTEKDLYIGFVNVTMGTDLRNYLIESTSLEISAYEDLLLADTSTSGNIEYTLASQAKILGAIETNKLDLVILDEDSFAAFSQNGYLWDIKDYINSNCPSIAGELEECYEKNIDLTDESNPVEYYSGINLNSNQTVKDAAFNGNIYLAIIKNTERIDSINQYLLYLYQ